VICGFSFLAVRMKWCGYPGEPIVGFSSGFTTLHWNHLALLLRHLGLVLLVVPFTWMVFTLISERRERFGFPFSFWMIIGVILPCAFIVTYFYLGFHPYYAVPNYAVPK
jgi:hypothetical protein